MDLRVAKVAERWSQIVCEGGDTRSLACDLAESLSQTDGMQLAAALLDRAEIPCHGSTSPVEPNPGLDSPPESIGAWHPEKKNGDTVFVRGVPEHVWRSDTFQFNPKGSRKRVVLLGESVARGYLYANHWTPAMVLERYLASTEAAGGVEVLDLTLVSLGLDELREHLLVCARLEPDFIVVFAGNNWFKKTRQVLASSPLEAVASLRAHGIPGMKRFLEVRLEDIIDQQILRPLAEVSSRTPVVFVLPEFNLTDWQHVDPRDVPWLEGKRLEEWLQLANEAELALSEGDVEQAHTAYTGMSEIDEDTTVLGLTGQAECARRKGELDQAEGLLRNARDCRILDASSVPSTYGVVEAAVRRTAVNGDFLLVDLPLVFKTHLDGELPDRRLFLDFCHLTSEGIRVSMAAVAETLAPRLGAPPVSRADLLALDVGPPADIEATARFLATVLNAHRGQRYEIVRYHCERALAAHPPLAKTLQAYLSGLGNVTPLWLSSALKPMEEQLGAGALTSYVVDHWVIGRDCLDLVLFEAIADTLDVSVSAGRTLWRQRIKSFGVTQEKPLEVCAEYFAKCQTEPPRVWTSWHDDKTRQPRANTSRRRPAAFAACARESRFSLLCRADASIAFQLTCRWPRASFPRSSAGRCRVMINGVELAELTVGHQWETYEFLAPSGALCTGVNNLTVHWSLDGLSQGEPRLEALAAAIERGATGTNILDLIYPVFGEIHSFRATATSSDPEQPEPQAYQVANLVNAPSLRGPGDSLIPARHQRCG